MAAKALGLLLLVLAIAWVSNELANLWHAHSIAGRTILAVWGIGACGFVLGVLATIMVRARVGR